MRDHILVIFGLFGRPKRNCCKQRAGFPGWHLTLVLSHYKVIAYRDVLRKVKIRVNLT